jgi:hypothetical protein
MALKDALQKLNDAIEDLTALHVQTYTGELNVSVEDNTSFDSIRAAIKDAKSNGTITLVAESLLQFDGDSFNFVTDVPVPQQALDIHRSAVETGLQTRQALIQLFKGAFDAP